MADESHDLWSVAAKAGKLVWYFCSELLGKLSPKRRRYYQRRFAAYCSALLSERIRGVVELQRIEEIGFKFGSRRLSATLKGLKIFDSTKYEVVGVDRARVKLNLTKLLERTIALSFIEIDGGFVRIDRKPEGGTRLTDALKGKGGDSSGGWNIDMPEIGVKNVSFIYGAPDSQGLSIANIHGYLGLSKDDGGVRVSFNELEGEPFEGTFLGKSVSLQRAIGSVQGGRSKLVDLTFEVVFGDGHVSVIFELLPGRDRPVNLILQPQGVAASIAAMAADLRSRLGESVQIEVL